MNHGLRSSIPHNWKCKCLPCRAWKAEYFREHRNGLDLFIPADEARKYLKTFADATDAARVTGVSQMTLWRIINKKVKNIRRSTEQRILARAA